MSERTDPPVLDDGFFRIPDHAGLNYIRFMEVLHRALHPTTYLEIGTARGDLLRLATCPSLSIDPNLELGVDAIAGKTRCFFFRQSSDEFFRDETPHTYLRKEIDFAFLDGPLLYERLLREFANVERHCRRSSIIFLHDCIPVDAHVARRSAQDTSWADRSSHPDWWSGDIWRAVALLKRYRPELRMHAFNAPPTGLIAVTNLDPDSRLIEEHYHQLVEEARTDGGVDYQGYVASLNVRQTSAYLTAEALAELFWA